MRVRMGKALYWVGVFFAVVIVVGTVHAASRSLYPKTEDVFTGLMVAAAAFGAGYGARYVLAGK